MELNAYHRQFNLWETVPDEVPPALAALRARGLRLVVVSNANGTLLSAFTRLGLAAAFDVIFDSHVDGIEKPDPRFFQLALERSGARAETTVHVGDLYHVDVVGARAAGIARDPARCRRICMADYDCPRVRSLTGLVELLANDRRVHLTCRTVAQCLEDWRSQTDSTMRPRRERKAGMRRMRLALRGVSPVAAGATVAAAGGLDPEPPDCVVERG